MLSSDLQQQLHEYVAPAQSIIIFFHDHHKADIIAASLGLYLQLQSMGKAVTIASPKHLGERWHDLPGASNVETEIANKNLQISFEYIEEAVDKVSYHIDQEERKFNLVIQPKKGSKPLNPKTIQFAQTGVEADLIITVGVHQLNDLGEFANNYSELFEQTPIISINSFLTEFGTVKIESADVSGYSELMSQALFVEYEALDPAAATNFLTGVTDVTRSFQSLNTTADTLETAARLLRAGAQRIMLAPTNQALNNMGKQQSTRSLAEAFSKTNQRVVEAVPVESLPKKAKTKTKNPVLNGDTLQAPPEYTPSMEH